MYNLVQEWFADDAAALRELIRVKTWWGQLNQLGIKDGFFPKASKCWRQKPKNLQILPHGEWHLDLKPKLSLRGRIST